MRENKSLSEYILLKPWHIELREREKKIANSSWSANRNFHFYHAITTLYNTTLFIWHRSAEHFGEGEMNAARFSQLKICMWCANYHLKDLSLVQVDFLSIRKNWLLSLLYYNSYYNSNQVQIFKGLSDYHDFVHCRWSFMN